MQIRQDCWLKDSCNHIDCEGFCLRNFKLNYLYESAFISVEQRKHISLVLDNDGTDCEVFTSLKKVQDNILDFVNNGRQIYLYSSHTGCGKTSWALRLAQTYLNKIWPTCKLECKVLFLSVPKLLSEMKRNISEDSDYAEHVKQNINKADLVIWDDVAVKASTAWEADLLFTMLDERISSGKANIYTSNLNGEELHEALGDRLASRVYTASVTFEFKGKDKRGL